MATAHRLGIGDLEARCTALARPAVAVRMGAVLDRALKDALPAALAREAGEVLDGLDGVIRIREVALRLDLGDRFEEGGIASALARRLAAAIRVMLARGEADVRAWPDHASYLAGYVLWRLGLAPGPDWPFADFTKLGHLPAERAAAELMRARPEILLPLAREGAGRGAAEAVLAGWPPQALTALAIALLEPRLSAMEKAALLPAIQALGAVLPSAAAIEDANEPLAAPALRLALRALAAATRPPPPRAAVIAAAALLVALVEHGDEGGAADDFPLRSARTPTDAFRVAGTRALTLIREEPARCTALDALVARAEAERARPAPSAEVRSRRPDERGASGRAAMRTPFAGLGLLWPSAIAMGAAEVLGPTRLAEAVWQTLDRADWEDAAADPALALLFPVEPREIDLALAQPAPPAALAERLDPAARALYAASPDGRRWSALLIGDFASRLRGLRGSSHGYLRAQFLRRRGTVEVGEDRLILRLAPVPLAVILRMAGLNGPQMRLPQPGARRLVLDLGGAG